MERHHRHSKQSGGLRTILLFTGFCLLFIVAIGALFYYLNQSQDMLPDAKPSAPIDNGPAH
jgi:hypothetical protein